MARSNRNFITDLSVSAMYQQLAAARLVDRLVACFHGFFLSLEDG